MHFASFVSCALEFVVVVVLRFSCLREKTVAYLNECENDAIRVQGVVPTTSMSTDC